MDEIELVVLDLVLPDLSGLESLHYNEEFCSGY